MNKGLSYLTVIFLIIFTATGCKENWDRMYTPAIASTWKVEPIETDNAGSFISGPVEMTWEAPEGTMLGGTEDGITPTTAANLITQYGSCLLANILKDVIIGEDYDISATYSDEISLDISDIADKNWKDSGTGYATYKEVSGKKKLLVFLDIDKITNGDEEIKSKINSFPVLKGLITEGIPVLYETTSGQNNIRFLIDLTLAKQLVPLIVSITPSIKDDDFQGKGSYIKFLLGNIEEVMNATKEFTLSVRMKK